MNRIYLLASGQANVISEFGSPVDTIKAQEWFGEVGPLQNVPRTASVSAVTDCFVYAFEKSFLESVLNVPSGEGLSLKKHIEESAKARMQAYLERCVLA